MFSQEFSKTILSDIKKAPDRGRGQPECFHNGIILIVICFKSVLKTKIDNRVKQIFIRIFL